MTAVEHSTDSARHIAKPAFAQPRLILYVLLGGAIGTAVREGLGLAMPWNADGVPWSVLIVNFAAAGILGFLLTALASRKPETPGRRDVRLFLGTGMMGGLSTYSELATDTAVLFDTGQPLLATGYALGSVLGGVALAGLGVFLAGKAFPARPAEATS